MVSIRPDADLDEADWWDTGRDSGTPAAVGAGRRCTRGPRSARWSEGPAGDLPTLCAEAPEHGWWWSPSTWRPTDHARADADHVNQKAASA